MEDAPCQTEPSGGWKLVAATGRWFCRGEDGKHLVAGDDESWRDLYSIHPQRSLFGDEEQQRQEGIDRLIETYKSKLDQLLGDRFLKRSRTLKNSKNSALFEFLFCVGNPKGIGPAIRIAEHILKDL